MWSEATIANALANQFFHRYEVVCPNCAWAGHEADLLVVHKSLRLIDVEIKISRADLKADKDKRKWWHHRWNSPDVGPPAPTWMARDWPSRVWKHYYVLPAEIWKPELLEFIPAKSGVITIRGASYPICESVRRATANKDATPITAADAMDITRLVSYRYWAMRTDDERRSHRLP